MRDALSNDSISHNDIPGINEFSVVAKKMMYKISCKQYYLTGPKAGSVKDFSAIVETQQEADENVAALSCYTAVDPYVSWWHDSYYITDIVVTRSLEVI